MLIDLPASEHHLLLVISHLPLLIPVARIVLLTLCSITLVPCFERAFRIDDSDELTIEISLPRIR